MDSLLLCSCARRTCFGLDCIPYLLGAFVKFAWNTINIPITENTYDLCYTINIPITKNTYDLCFTLSFNSDSENDYFLDFKLFTSDWKEAK